MSTLRHKASSVTIDGDPDGFAPPRAMVAPRTERAKRALPLLGID